MNNIAPCRAALYLLTVLKKSLAVLAIAIVCSGQHNLSADETAITATAKTEHADTSKTATAIEATAQAQNTAAVDTPQATESTAESNSSPTTAASAAVVPTGDEFTEPSAAQIKQLPFEPPSLRTATSNSQRLVRHSQIVHSKVLAWLDLPYAQSTGFRPVTLDLFVPNNSVAGDSRLPLLLVLHEGNPQHFHSQYNRHFADTAELFTHIAATGITVAAINYRSPRETTINGQVNDLRAAIRWLEINGDDYRLGKHYALWSFDGSGDIAQTLLLFQQQQQPASAQLNAQQLQLKALVMWQPTALHSELNSVPLLAINPQTLPLTAVANQQWLRYRQFGDSAPLSSALATAASTKAEPEQVSSTAEPRLDALSRSLQFLQQALATP